MMLRSFLCVTILLAAAGLTAGCDDPAVEYEVPFLQSKGPSQVSIMWFTEKHRRSCLEYWIRGDGDSSSPASRCTGSSKAHELILSDLVERATYSYRILPEDPDLLPEIYEFTTDASGVDPYSFAVVGDSHGNEEVFTHILDAALHTGFGAELMVHTGDAVDEGKEESNWFFDFIDPGRDYLSSVPMYCAMGNHERSADLFRKHHSFPAVDTFYSFDHKNALFIFVDTNENYSPGSVQHSWLSETLTSREAAEATWLFVIMHHPPYTEGWDECGVYDGEKDARRWLVPLFEDAGVDVVLSGHTHGYERGELKGVTYFITGGGGGALDHHCRSWDHVDSAFYRHHYLDVRVSEDSLTITARSPGGEPLEETVIEK